MDNIYHISYKGIIYKLKRFDYESLDMFYARANYFISLYPNLDTYDKCMLDATEWSYKKFFKVDY